MFATFVIGLVVGVAIGAKVASALAFRSLGLAEARTNRARARTHRVGRWLL